MSAHVLLNLLNYLFVQHNYAIVYISILVYCFNLFSVFLF